MQYTTLGKTGLRVSVAGLGTGGFSRMGLKSGKTEDEAARLVLDAVELGINFIDTAPPTAPRAWSARRSNRCRATRSWSPPSRPSAATANGGRRSGWSQASTIRSASWAPTMSTCSICTASSRTCTITRSTRSGRCSIAQQAKGKIRHIGLTENPIVDFTNETLKRALRDPVWEVFMVGFHMMHQGARENVFPVTRANGVGTLLMFAVRSIFADPPRVAREMKELAAKGLVEKWLGETDDPLGFLVHEHGAANMIEAAYRFARHEPGVDVVLFGTGDAEHLRSNVASLLKPPLPDADRAKLAALFGHSRASGSTAIRAASR